ncbi:MAG TPA: hypothetical protein PLA87_09675 [Pseudomonadota bacterium]|jgi:hypothetical protein|nr:hypothetical protein [Pseudomonadota bacterium]
MPDFVPLGMHRYYEEGDTLFFQGRGPLSLQEMQRLLEQLDQLGQRQGYVLLVCDVSHGIEMPPGVRHWLSEWQKNNPKLAIGTTIVIGASLIIRTLITMMNRAMALLGKTEGTLLFVKSEEEARSLLPTQRASWQQQQSRSQAKRR